MILIKDVMHRKILTIAANNTVLDAAKKMATKGVTCLVVVQKGKLKGIITLRDLLDKVVLKKRDSQKIKVSEIMTSPVKSAEAGSDIFVAIGMMNNMSIKQLPIVSKGKPVGIVTQTDLIKNMTKIMRMHVNRAEERINKLVGKLTKDKIIS